MWQLVAQAGVGAGTGAGATEGAGGKPIGEGAPGMGAAEGRVDIPPGVRGEGATAGAGGSAGAATGGARGNMAGIGDGPSGPSALMGPDAG